MRDRAQRGEENRASFAVGVSSDPGRPKTRYALFLTHGMGQSLPFQIIDQVATSLCELDTRRHRGNNPKPIARTVKIGDDRLSYIELRLKTGAEAVEVHLYEGYWAPMTEGRINARNVMAFLSGAGLNALRHARSGFKRWMFDTYELLPVPVTSVFFLMTALATLASLVIMNSTIAIVAAATAILAARPEWLSEGLLLDLTTTFNIVVAIMGLFGLSLLLAAHMRRPAWPTILTQHLAWLAQQMRRNARLAALMRKLAWLPAGLKKIGAFIRKKELLMHVRRGWSFVTLVLFVLALAVVIVAGLAIPLLFYGHVRDLAGDSSVLLQWFPRLSSFNGDFNRVALAAGVAFVAYVTGRWGWRLARGVVEDVLSKATGHPAERNGSAGLLTVLVAILFAGLVILLGLTAYRFTEMFTANGGGKPPFAATTLAWPLFVAASAYIRLVLVQYVGDVAIYIMPYKLDAFADLRREVQLRVSGVARAIYSQRQYDGVIVVGHSLGSVIAYDTLNNLIVEDQAKKAADKLKKGRNKSKKEFLDVVKRTPLFLTFGCPLDKTAFVFAVQPKGTSEAREALAASVQPLIQSYDYRPKKWINVWSPWDILAGPLDLYDLPRNKPGFPEDTIPQRVQNVLDREATTLLMAHTEYWENERINETIYDYLKPV